MTEIKAIVKRRGKIKMLHGITRANRVKKHDTSCRYYGTCKGDIALQDCTGCRLITEVI